MSFTLGYLNIDGNQIDLLSLPVLETTNKRFSSRTISLSGNNIHTSSIIYLKNVSNAVSYIILDYYEEVSLLLGQELKLSCLYDRSPREKGVRILYKRTYVTWLLLDKWLQSYGKT